jgi:predicted ATPase
LADSGFQTAPEAARLYFEREVATGRTVEEIRGDSIPCIQGIIDMMLEFERGFFPYEIVFLDRGCPDVLAFCRQFGVDPNDFLPDCFHHQYASIFLLDRFPVHLNGIRVEDEAAADYLDKWHYRDYIALGYQVVRVPVLPPEERLAFVFEVFSEQNQI